MYDFTGFLFQTMISFNLYFHFKESIIYKTTPTIWGCCISSKGAIEFSKCKKKARATFIQNLKIHVFETLTWYLESPVCVKVEFTHPVYNVWGPCYSMWSTNCHHMTRLCCNQQWHRRNLLSDTSWSLSHCNQWLSACTCKIQTTL